MIPVFTPTQKQIITGTLLGGSSLVKPQKGKNCYISMRDRNENWLRYKTFELASLFKNKTPYVKKENNTFRTYSLSLPCFSEIYKSFYKNGKRYINVDILESLNDMAWMTWYYDSGFTAKNHVHLRVTRYNNNDILLIQNYFNSLNCECEIKDKIIKFTPQGSLTFMKTISHRIPKFLLK